MWTILRSFPAWVVTAADDILVQKAWAALRRGEPRTALAVLADLVSGWAPVFLLLAGIAAAAVLAAAMR
jgi:hypothetical protein